MKIGTVRAVLFVLALSAFAADITLGCGQGFVYGPVTQKYHVGADADEYIIAVNDTPYSVPQSFYNQVGLGDTVKYTGKQWVLVKTARGTTPKTPGTTTPGPTY